MSGQIGRKSEALGFLLRTLTDFGLRATFFVEALHTAYFEEDAMGRYVDDIKSAKQDVQLHVHPCWLTFRPEHRSSSDIVSDQCCEHSEQDLIEMLKDGMAQLRRWTGEAPVAFRAGGYSVSRDVYRAMKSVGLSASSNICAGYAPSPDPDLRLPGGTYDIEGVKEFPVTCFRDPGPVGRGRLRGMQVTACAAWEFRQLLEAAFHQRYSPIVIVTHPFEFIKRDCDQYTKMTVNRINQRRFRWLCGYLAENADRFEVAAIPDLALAAPQPSIAAPPELAGHAVSSLLRSAQNVLNDRIWFL